MRMHVYNMNGMTRSTRGGKAVCVEEDFWNVKFLGVVMDENPDVFQVFSLLMMLSFYLSHVLEKMVVFLFGK